MNANDDERTRTEKGRLGEASRVVCLTRLVGSEDEVDDEIVEEIGGECSNYGYVHCFWLERVLRGSIVERVLLHMVEPPPDDPAECLRVFVVFSGLAGAWRATKELNGRLFGGRNIVRTCSSWFFND